MKTIRVEKKMTAHYIGRRTLSQEGVLPFTPCNVMVRGIIADLDGIDHTSLKIYIGLTQVGLNELDDLRDAE